jgi:hypothetical protein
MKIIAVNQSVCRTKNSKLCQSRLQQVVMLKEISPTVVFMIKAKSSFRRAGTSKRAIDARRDWVGDSSNVGWTGGAIVQPGRMLSAE